MFLVHLMAEAWKERGLEEELLCVLVGRLAAAENLEAAVLVPLGLVAGRVYLEAWQQHWY